MNELVGRDEERRSVERALAYGVGAVVMGAAGVGKTRLARAAAHGFGSARAVVWVVGTRSAVGVPFGAFAHLLPDRDLPGRDRMAVMMLARRSVLGAAGEDSILVVDDAHLLDPMSAALVHSLALARLTSLVVTVRTGEPAPDAVTALWKDGVLECLELQPLARAEVDELVAALLDGPVDARVYSRIWEATRGNALFCCELLQAAKAAGVLARGPDGWRWRGSLPGAGRLWDVLEARLAELETDERSALETIALADGSDAALLVELVDSAARVALVRRALVEEAEGEAGSVLRLAHPLYGDALRRGMSVGRRRALCRQLADAAEARGLAFGPELLRVAGWRLDAGQGGDPRLFIAAARRAQSAFDPRLAERCARAASAAGGGPEAERALAIALGGQGQVALAEEIFTRLEREATDDAERAALAGARGEMLMLSGVRAADAAAVAGRAADGIRPGRARDELRVFEAAWGWLSGDSRIVDRRDEWARIERENKRLGRLVAWALVPQLGMAGRIERALDMLDRWESPAGPWRDALPFVSYSQRAFRAYVLWLAGRLSDAVTYCDRERGALFEAGDRGGAAVLEPARAAALIDIGRIVTAARALEEALVLLEELGMSVFVTWSYAYLALARALAGDAAGGRAALEQARAACPNQVRVHEPELGTAEVWIAVADGDLPGACELSGLLAADHDTKGRLPAAARALHDVARLGEPAGVAAPLAELASRTDAPIVTVKAEHAAALVASDGAALSDQWRPDHDHESDRDLSAALGTRGRSAPAPGRVLDRSQQRSAADRRGRLQRQPTRPVRKQRWRWWRRRRLQCALFCLPVRRPGARGRERRPRLRGQPADPPHRARSVPRWSGDPQRISGLRPVDGAVDRRRRSAVRRRVDTRCAAAAQ